MHLELILSIDATGPRHPGHLLEFKSCLNTKISNTLSRERSTKIGSSFLRLQKILLGHSDHSFVTEDCFWLAVWCRRTDELVDGPNATYMSSAVLDRWKERLQDIFDGRPYDMLDAALTDTIFKFPIDIKVMIFSAHYLNNLCVSSKRTIVLVKVIDVLFPALMSWLEMTKTGGLSKQLACNFQE